MILEHRGRRPRIDPEAYIAPTATICGDVEIGAGARILFGAVVTAGDGYVRIGANSIVMEQAIVRGRADHPAILEDNVVVGPHSQVNGGSIGDGSFLATGSSVFPGARLESNVQVGFGALVHLGAVLPHGSAVPIGWVAVGSPAEILSADQHERIQTILTESDESYAPSEGGSAAERMALTSAQYGEHRNDREVGR